MRNGGPSPRPDPDAIGGSSDAGWTFRYIRLWEEASCQCKATIWRGSRSLLKLQVPSGGKMEMRPVCKHQHQPEPERGREPGRSLFGIDPDPTRTMVHNPGAWGCQAAFSNLNLTTPRFSPAAIRTLHHPTLLVSARTNLDLGLVLTTLGFRHLPSSVDEPRPPYPRHGSHTFIVWGHVVAKLQTSPRFHSCLGFTPVIRVAVRCSG